MHALHKPNHDDHRVCALLEYKYSFIRIFSFQTGIASLQNKLCEITTLRIALISPVDALRRAVTVNHNGWQYFGQWCDEKSMEWTALSPISASTHSLWFHAKTRHARSLRTTPLFSSHVRETITQSLIAMAEIQFQNLHGFACKYILIRRCYDIVSVAWCLFLGTVPSSATCFPTLADTLARFDQVSTA